MNEAMYYLNIALGGVERPTQPPEASAREVADDARLLAQARISVVLRALQHDYWQGLFDDTRHEHVDMTSIASALHLMYIGDETSALELLRDALIATQDSLVREEHKELRRDCE